MFTKFPSVGRILTCAILFCCSSFSGINAATIDFEVNEDMGCSISVTGVIEGGDAKKLADLIKKQEKEDSTKGNYFQSIQSVSGRRICFNSPGGSMVEGMALARVIAGRFSPGEYNAPLGTAVGRNGRCESACALAFMAGSRSGEEGTVWHNRVLHPTAKLGFHRPSLIVSSGAYTEKEIDAAFSVALDTLKIIISSRSEGWYKFPESLFMSLLTTPSSDMYYIQTVGEASRLSIQVAPTPFYNGVFSKSILNFCTSVDGGLLDMEPPATFGMFLDALDVKPNSDLGSWTIEGGFRQEAASGCTVVIFNDQADRTDSVGYVFIGEYDPDRREDVWPFQSFPSETQITVLDQAAPFLIAEFNDAAETFRPKSIFGACWLSKDAATVTNVKEYVNLRRQPDLNAPSLRRVLQGEVVRLIEPNSMWFIEAQRGRELCFEACRAVGANQQNTVAAGNVRQCIDDNRLWYEITDARGNRGWISRKFLKEAQ